MVYATGDLVGNKIAEKIATAASQSTHEDSNKAIGIPKERYISPERRHHITDKHRLLQL